MEPGGGLAQGGGALFDGGGGPNPTAGAAAEHAKAVGIDTVLLRVLTDHSGGLEWVADIS
jgi:hypothetical protein